ncbi:DUF4350 domain-containing protein [Microbacterium esteraromaticum]|uniref:DUF4350 domain-containing protein n=1 Tax=Microbacterium esteraromaticum TaxID=57043 RepID=UPI001C98950E|nr:DUF4350 domain-containing protein [Microbacterium esteraromaticum]MBY6060696.1 DUF4350 domain-containing protein [Microbacterium esteraromaticum]
MSAVTDDTTRADAVGGRSTAAAPPSGRLGRALGWLAIVVVVVVLALMSLRLLIIAPDLSGPLNPESPGPNGAKAIAELTRQEGVQIEITRSRTVAAAAGGTGSTLVLTDPAALSDAAAMELIESADRVVLLTSSARMLRLLDLGERGFPAGLVSPGCDLVEFSRVGSIDADRAFTPASDVTGCFSDTRGDAAVLRSTDAQTGQSITMVDATGLLANQHLAENGNAALGLALLAQTDEVVWYIPTFEDGDRTDGAPATLGDLTPDWLTPAIVLLLLAGVAVVVWRGRRFGPLVAESLPVTVRVSETMHGRARLTAQSADAAHAASAIRDGSRRRLAARLSLSPTAAAHEVADAAADRLRVPRGSLHELLAGAPPHSDHDLVDIARRLADLETAVDAAVHTERNLP